MDVMEKLVELVDKARRYAANKCHSFMSCAECDHYGEHDGNCRNTYIAESLIADGVTAQEWIPVSEPPKEKGTYIVCTDKGGVLLGHWYGKEWNVGGGAKKHLAYWMKKPEPPKGE